MIFQENEDATYGANIQTIQTATGATQATAYRWKKHPEAIPEAAKRLIRFYVFGELSEVLGEDWKGFTFGGGHMSCPNFHRALTPRQFGALFYTQQDLYQTRTALKNTLRLLDEEKTRSAKLRAMVAGVPHLHIY